MTTHCTPTTTIKATDEYFFQQIEVINKMIGDLSRTIENSNDTDEIWENLRLARKNLRMARNSAMALKEKEDKVIKEQDEKKPTITFTNICGSMLTFKQDGAIKIGAYTIGTWEKVDVWKKCGSLRNPSRDISGNKLVHYMWDAHLVNGHDCMACYTREELRKAIAFRLDKFPVTVEK